LTLFAYWACILILQPEEDALLVVGVLALELNHVFPHLHLVLAHRTRLSHLLHLSVVQPLDLLLTQSLRNLSYLVAQVKQLLYKADCTS
jgi:hypothetical protein